MIFFELIIGPFLYVIKQLFLGSYTLTGNYGWAIVLLSFAISLLLLPVFILIEKAKKRDDAVKRRMQPLVDEIKRCYKGQERYYYLKTLNRQYNYSPLRALIPVLSLLLQIPFFIAAYKYLDGLEALKGVSFLFINDLSQPDGLLGSIHLLPILMTVVNLITAWFYTRNGNTGERKQMLVVAAVFLVLLSNLPSGLVLYWTMNNVFSFFRLFVTNKEVFRNLLQRVPKYQIFDLLAPLNGSYRSIRNIFFLLAITSVFSQFNWARLNHFDNIHIRVFSALITSFFLSALILVFTNLYKKYRYPFFFASKAKIILSSFFISIYFFIAGFFYYSEINTPILITGLIFSTLTFVLVLVSEFIKWKTTPGKIQLIKIILFSVILIFHTSVFLLIAKGDFISKLITGLTIYSQNLILAGYSLIIILLQATIILVNVLKKTSFNNKVKIPYALIYFLSIFYILGLIFFWHPLLTFSSFPDGFAFPAIAIIKHNLPYFLIYFIGAFIFYLIFEKYNPYLIVLCITILTISSFVYSSIISLDMGTFQLGKYTNESNLQKEIIFYVIELAGFFAAFKVVRYYLNEIKYKYLVGFIILINFTITIHSIYKVSETNAFFVKKNPEINSSNSLTFSTENKNTVYFIADMFMGMYIKEMLNEIPELAYELDGFTWYPNCVSTSSITCSSFPAMFAGSNYSIDKLNKDKAKTMGEKVTESINIFIDSIKANDFNFTGNKIIYSNIDPKRYDTYIPVWHSDWDKFDKLLKIGTPLELDYTLLIENALFNAAPIFLKARIYNKGKWLHKETKNNENTNAAKPLNFIRILPFLSETKTGKGNFILYHSKATHLPHNLIDTDGKLVRDVKPYENQKWFILEFIKWIKWMKKNGVYDNTRIVLLSDHSHHLPAEMAENFGDSLKWEGAEKLSFSAQYFWRLNSLMMIKNFNSHGKLQENWSLISNSDSPEILFNDTFLTELNTIRNRKIRVSFTDWTSGLEKRTNIDIMYHFEVKNNIYNYKNWDIKHK